MMRWFRLFCAMLLSISSLAFQEGETPAPEAGSDRFEFTFHGDVNDQDGYRKAADALYALLKTKLGQAEEPKGKFAVEVYADEEDFRKDAAKGSFHLIKEGKIYLLQNKRFFNWIAPEITRLYLSTAFSKLADRKDIPSWMIGGICDYFGTAEWKDGAILIDQPQLPETSLNVMSLQQLIKSNDWMGYDKAVKLEPKEIDRSRRLLEMEAWAAYYYLFNAPGDNGGKGEFHAQVPEMLAAMNSGTKGVDALLAAAQKARAGNFNTFDKQVKEYVKKIKSEVGDRVEGDWHVGDTAHYTIYVQKGTRNKKTGQDDKAVLKDMKFKMELLFEKYALAFNFQGKLSQKASMRLYKNKDQYHAAGGPGSSAAYYMPATKELVGYEDSDDTGIVFQIFCHEGCHQFFDLAFPGFYDTDDLPMWFSEGLADCFGCSEIRGKQLVVFTLSGVASWRIETIKVAVNTREAPTLKDLLAMSREPFMANGSLHYAQSWSFCHFLWNYPSIDEGKGRYQQCLIKLIEGFKVGRPKEEVYQNAFQLGGKSLDIDQLETEWKDFVRKLKVKKAVGQ